MPQKWKEQSDPAQKCKKKKNEINKIAGELFCSSKERSFKHCSEEVCFGAEGMCIENPEG